MPTRTVLPEGTNHERQKGQPESPREGWRMSKVMLRLLAAGREVRRMVWSPTRAAEVRPMVDTGDIQPGARVSFIAADRDHDAGRLDAAAGCEFVDDRIRY